MSDDLLSYDIIERAGATKLGARKRIRLIVSDIEGCINSDERTYDHDALAWIRRANVASSASNAIPPLTLCSGRQAAFVEAISRFVESRYPAVFENGCGLFYALRDDPPRHEFFPDLESRADEIKRLHAACIEVASETGASVSIGKSVLVTLYPAATKSVTELRELVTEELAARGVTAAMANSASAVDIAPQGVDKGTGLKWLISATTDELGVDLASTAAVGDARGDLPFLELAGFSAAPSNAADQVKAAVDYDSPHEGARGLVDIYRRCIERNLEP